MSGGQVTLNLDLVASGDFVLGRDVLCEFDYWPLAVSMPPTKVYPQCKAAVPVRRKTCDEKQSVTHKYNHMHCCAEGLALQCLSFYAACSCSVSLLHCYVSKQTNAIAKQY